MTQSMESKGPKEGLEGLVSIELLLDRYQTTLPLLEGNLAALKIQTQYFDGELYIALAQLERLDEFHHRLAMGWLVSLLQRQDRQLKGI